MTPIVLRHRPGAARSGGSIEAARRAARALDRMIEDADSPGRGLACAPPKHRAAILAARREITALATDLVECDRCHPRAVEIASAIGRCGVMALFTAAGAQRTVADARAARALLRVPIEEAA